MHHYGVAGSLLASFIEMFSGILMFFVILFIISLTPKRNILTTDKNSDTSLFSVLECHMLLVVAQL